MGPNLTNPEKSSNHQLDPVIKTVLGCLDINLENELNLYRKNKRLQEKNNPVGSMGGYRSAPVPGVMIQTTETEVFGSSADEMDNVDVLPTADHQADLLDNQSLDSQNIVSPSNDSETVMENDALSRQEAIMRIANISDTSANASLVKQDNSAVNPDQEEKETSIASNLFTPLGLLSMLLFFLSCMGLGYLLNSSENIAPLPSFNWQSWLNKTPEAPTSQPTALPTTTPTTIISVNPDLTSREFIDLDLNTLSNINPKATPIPTPSPAMTIPPVPSPVDPNKNPNNKTNQVSSGLNNLSTTLLPPLPPSSPVTSPSPSPNNTISPSAVSATPQNSPSAQASSPNPTPLKSNDGFYYVVINYVDEASWQKARSIIPDAYIRQGSDGSRKIQLGAFNDEKSARRFVQELQAKGLVGQYYRF
jgi:hypothetical protein